MARIKLTAGRIREFQCPLDKAQAFLWDSEAPGLAVRATPPGKRSPSGSKAYIFQSTLGTKNFRLTIGDCKAWSIDQAQAEARRLQGMIDQGIDPRHAKADQLAETEARRIAEEHEAQKQIVPALTAWHEYIQQRQARWSTSHLADHNTVSKPGGEKRTRGRRSGESDITQPGILIPLLSLPLPEIDTEKVRLWLTEESTRRPTHARLAFGLLRAFLNWCGDQPHLRDSVNLDACTPRVTKETLPKKRAKDDCLQREQLRAWFASVKRISNPGIAAYLQVTLLTGARREEIASLRWEDVDFKWNTLTIRDKVEGQRTIPLTPYVASLLAILKAKNETPPSSKRKNDSEKADDWTPSPWVFSSKTSKTGRLQEPRIQHNKALTEAGLPALSIHGLRRSFGTLAEWVECPAGVVAQIQGHKPSATAEKHYRVRPIDLLRVWHTKIEAWMLEQAGVKFKSLAPNNKVPVDTSS